VPLQSPQGSAALLRRQIEEVHHATAWPQRRPGGGMALTAVVVPTIAPLQRIAETNGRRKS
jgi:hypothetical protein